MKSVNLLFHLFYVYFPMQNYALILKSVLFYVNKLKSYVDMFILYVQKRPIIKDA